MIVRCEPLPLWTYGGGTPTRSRFDSPWPSTLELLQAEARHLGAREIVLAGGWTPEQIRRDGWPRAQARPAHPGVAVRLIGTKHGDLAYPCRTFTSWQDNVRAVALALEALRKVDRYGVTRHGEQYRGFAALPAGGGTSEGQGQLARGRALIAEHGSVRAAQRAAHPDHGGDPDDFYAVQAVAESGANGGGD